MRRLALLALLLSAALAGCGGGDDTTSTTSVPAGSSVFQSTSEDSQHSPGNAGSPAPAKPSRPEGLSPTNASPLPNQGTKAVAPGVPTVKRGDNSIQSYGVESEGPVRAEAASVLNSYLAALLTRKWSRACSLLVGETKESLENLASRAAKRAVQCPEAVASLVSRVPKGPLRTLGELHVLSMRIQGNRGFLIYKDGAGSPSESAMVHEGGRWLVRAVIAKELLNRGSLVE